MVKTGDVGSQGYGRRRPTTSVRRGDQGDAGEKTIVDVDSHEEPQHVFHDAFVDLVQHEKGFHG